MAEFYPHCCFLSTTESPTLNYLTLSLRSSPIFCLSRVVCAPVSKNGIRTFDIWREMQTAWPQLLGLTCIVCALRPDWAISYHLGNFLLPHCTFVEFLEQLSWAKLDDSSSLLEPMFFGPKASQYSANIVHFS